MVSLRNLLSFVRALLTPDALHVGPRRTDATVGDRVRCIRRRRSRRTQARRETVDRIFCGKTIRYTTSAGPRRSMRMRGWILLALARTGMTGCRTSFRFRRARYGDRCRISSPQRRMRCGRIGEPCRPSRRSSCRRSRTFAIGMIPSSFDEYGGYAIGADATSPVVELLRTLGVARTRCARNSPALEALAKPEGGLPGPRRR